MPPDLRALLEASAEEGARSLHAEIITRLWSTFQKKDVPEKEGSKHRIRGVDKRALIESSIAGVGVTREDLMDAISVAVESALVGLGALPSAPDNATPQPNTGPKSRKRFPKG
ncbi:hypothetical protein [Pseudomonas capeferrum]|uniref:hypothetical protein n=1 Tax=Pseudomonas capeferrum TaxID=1495066 RepID=UPI0035C24FFE